MSGQFLLLAGPRAGDLTGRIDQRLGSILPRTFRAAHGMLFAADAAPILPLPTIEGWLIGSLYDASGRAPVRHLPSSEQLAILSSGGRSALQHHSGSYLLIWRDLRSGDVLGFRDPSACQPAWWHEEDGLVVFASDPDLLWRSGIVRPRIDVDGVAHWLRFPHLATARTCVEGIGELVPGERRRFVGRSETGLLWRPWSFVRHNRRDVSSVAGAIDSVVEGQTAGLCRVGIELSGGLDSSIVADALHRAGVACVGYHLVPDAGDGDERRYAACVAKAYDLPLVELPLTATDMEPLARPTRRTARPTGVRYMRAIDRRFREAWIRSDVKSVFSGGGGDSVFCAISSTAPILDAWRDGGRALAVQAVRDVAQVTETTHWAVARALVRRCLRDAWRPWHWPADDHLLDHRCRPDPDLHPWLDLPPGIPPGTRGHIASLLRIQSVIGAHDRMVDGELRLPLLAQPVMEACLAIPSWQWMEGGRDRAVARQAFAGRVPDLILQRRGKGRLDTLTIRAFERSRTGLRDLLCGGWLADRHLIDGEAIARALASPVSARSQDYPRILALADAELWARSIDSGEGIAGSG